jgi:hypothetical protein
MARINVFADESGNFDFSRRSGASKYFILTTVTMVRYAVADALMTLRRDLAWEGEPKLKGFFHATEDTWPIRNRVFAALAPHGFRVDATILEKCKAQPQTRVSEERFYQTAWYLHMKYLVSRIKRPTATELFVVSASLGTKGKRAAMYKGVCEVIEQVSKTDKFRTACWDAAHDPCLQIADYCSWAISRKWETGDTGPYSHISAKIRSEFNAWSFGTTKYY